MRTGLVSGGVLMALLLSSEAHAYIEALYPLKNVIKESSVIVEGVVEKVDAARKTGIIKVTRTLKGKCTYTHIRMNIGVGQMWHPEVILPHLVEGAPAMVFYNHEHKAIGFTNRFFFQLYGDPRRAPARAWWTFTHIEIYMNRTFDGSTEDLTRLMRDILTGRAKPPAADEKKKPFTKEQLVAMTKSKPSGEVPVEPGREPPVPKEEDLTPSVQPDEEGFIRSWLLLDPISVLFVGSHSADVEGGIFNKEWIEKVSDARPKPGDKIKVAEKERGWIPFHSMDWAANLGEFCGRLDKTPESRLFIGYVYLHCDKALEDVRLAIGSDDSSMWVLNDKEVIRVHAPRGVERDQNVSEPLTLKKGLNVLRVYVINGHGGAGCAARFLNKDKKPVRDFYCTITPEPPKQQREY